MPESKKKEETIEDEFPEETLAETLEDYHRRMSFSYDNIDDKFNHLMNSN